MERASRSRRKSSNSQQPPQIGLETGSSCHISFSIHSTRADPGSHPLRSQESPLITHEPTPTAPQPDLHPFPESCLTAVRTFGKVLQLKVHSLSTRLWSWCFHPQECTHEYTRRSDKILKTWAKSNRQLPLLGRELAHLVVWQLFFPSADLTCLNRKWW